MILKRLIPTIHKYLNFWINLIPYIAQYQSGKLKLNEHFAFKLLDIKEKIWLLDDENFNFPTLEQMGGDLVAIGGDFHPQRLLNAYENGLFPWFIDDYNYINWYSPKKRMILYPNDLKVSKSLKKSIKNYQ